MKILWYMAWDITKQQYLYARSPLKSNANQYECTDEHAHCTPKLQEVRSNVSPCVARCRKRDGCRLSDVWLSFEARAVQSRFGNDD